MLSIVGGICVTCLFGYLFRKSCTCYLFLLEESDCSASRDMTVAFRVWLSDKYDFHRNGITVLLCGLKYFTCLSSAGVTLH